MIKITSASNQLIKDVCLLKKASERKKQGLFLVDGFREINLASEAGAEIVKLLYCPEYISDNNKRTNSDLLKDEQLFELSKNVFEKICFKENPDGFLAIIKIKEKEIGELKLKDDSLVVVLEGVEKPGNLGAIIRTAAAVGATAIIVNDSQTDIYNPNVIRASEGQVFSQNIIISSQKETVNWLKDNKIMSFGAATTGAKNYTECNYSGRTAIVLGSEADGLSDFWLKSANKLIKIPMKGKIDSLNVSVSAAIILFEVIKQREK